MNKIKVKVKVKVKVATRKTIIKLRYYIINYLKQKTIFFFFYFGFKDIKLENEGNNYYFFYLILDK